MNAGGFGPALSVEVIQATATGLVFLVAALWAVIGIGALWRRRVWSQAGATVHEVAGRVGGTIVPIWGGWRIEKGRLRIDFAGGLAGELTRVVKEREGTIGWLQGPLHAEEVAGFADVARVLGLVEAIPADGPQNADRGPGGAAQVP